MTTPEVFLELTAPLLEGAPLDMLEGEVLPVHRMADILGAEDPNDQERMLADHEAAVEEVTSALEGYIDEHYESFNSSIAFFSEMIVKIEAAKDAVSSVKASIDSAASLLNPRYDELLDRRRRWARCIVRGQLLSEMADCIRAEVRAVQLQAEGNAVGAVKNLTKYRRKAARIADEGVRSFEPLVSRVDARLSALPLHETAELLHAIFALNIASARKNNRNSDDKAAVVGGVGSAARVDLSLLPTPAQVDDACRHRFRKATERSPELQLAARVRAIHLTDQAQHLLDALTRDAPASELGPWAAQIMDAAADKCASYDAASTRVELFVEMVASAMEAAIARAAAVALFGACCELPLLHGIITAGSVDTPESWALDAWENDHVATVAREAVNTASTRTASRGADHQSGMAKLTQAFLDAPTACGEFGTLAGLLADIDATCETLKAAPSNAHLADAIDDCSKTLRSAAHEAALSDASRRVAQVLQRWTLQPLWTAMQAQLASVIEALLGDNGGVDRRRGGDSDFGKRQRSSPSLGATHSGDGGRATPPPQQQQASSSISTVARVAPNTDGLPALLAARAPSGVPKFIDALGAVTTTTLEGASRSLSAATADKEAHEDSGMALIASKLNVQPSADLAAYVLPPAQRFLIHIGRMPGVQLCPKSDGYQPHDNNGPQPLEASIQRGIEHFSASIASDVLSRLETLAAATQHQQQQQSAAHDPTKRNVLASSSSSSSSALMLPCGFDVSSKPPLLAIVLAANEALQDLWPLRKALPALAERPTRKAAERVVENAAMHAKHALELAARGSFGWTATKDDLDMAFSHAPSSDWNTLTMADSAGGVRGLSCRAAQGPLDRRVSSVYRELSESHAAGGGARSRSPTAAASATDALLDGASGSGGGGDMRSRLLPDHAAISQIACISHSLEWLAVRFLQFVQKRRDVDTSLSPVPCRGDSAAVVHGDSNRERGIATFAQLGCVAQSALAVIAADVKLLTCIHMHELRDVSYNVTCEGSGASSFVSRLASHLTRHIAAVEPHVAPAKLRYVAVAAANPAAELFVQEASFLRDKRITSAGARQIAIDLRTLGRVLCSASPSDAALCSEVDAALNRARTYFSVMSPDRGSLVHDIVARGMHRSFSRVELENLIAMACRDARDDSAYAMIAELRKVLDQEVQDAMTMADSPQQRSSSSAATPQLAQSLAALRLAAAAKKPLVAKSTSPSPSPPRTAAPASPTSITAAAPLENNPHASTPAADSTPAMQAPLTSATAAVLTSPASRLPSASTALKAAAAVAKLGAPVPAAHDEDEEGEEVEEEEWEEEEEWDEEEEEEEEEEAVR